MPIKDLRGRLPVIGQIRKGDKDDKGIPMELDHFRVVFNPSEKAAEQIFRDAYGDQPTQIRVMFPSNDLDQIWDAWLIAFQGKTLVAKADGERYWYKIDTKTGERLVENGLPFTPYDRNNVEYTYTTRNGKVREVRCTPRARMYVMVKELFEQGYMACLEFHTGSWNDIGNIDHQIGMMMALSKREIAYTPMVLTMYPETIQRTTANGRKADKQTHLVKLEIDPAYARAALARLHAQDANLLPAGGDWEPPVDEEPSYEEGYFISDDEPEAETQPLPEDTSVPGSWTEYWEIVRSPGFALSEEVAKKCAEDAGKDLTKAWRLLKEQISQEASLSADNR